MNKANLTAMADPKSIVYGESIPALTFTYLGFVNGDDQTDLDDPPSPQTSAVKCNSNVGTHYSINFSSDPGSDKNYNITTVSANLTINKADLIVTALSEDNATTNTITYGEDPALSVSYSGFECGDKAEDLDNLPSPRGYTSCDGVGTYPINFTDNPSSDNNYNFIYQPLTLTVDKADLIVTALSEGNATTNTITYGEDPAFSVFYSLFECGDREGDLDNPPSPGGYISCNDVGIYTIDFTDNPGSDNNYNFIYQNLTLTVDKANLTVTANNETITYGDVPSLEFSHSGLVCDDELIDLNDPPSVSGYLQCQDTGTYILDFNDDPGVDNNYNITSVSGMLLVEPAPFSFLKVKADRILINTDDTGIQYFWGIENDTVSGSTTRNEFRFDQLPIDDTYWSSVCYENGCCVKTFLRDSSPSWVNTVKVDFSISPNPGDGNCHQPGIVK